MINATAFGQNSINTDQINQVYSRFGVGVITPETNIRNNSMGMTGIASPGRFSINSYNPALLTYNNATSFEFNVLGDFRSAVDAAGTEYSDNETSIASIGFAFPIILNKWQTSFGLRPYSKVNYSAFSFTPVGQEADSMFNYIRTSGQGAISQVSWRNGIRLFRNFNIGLETSYYFGNIFSNNLSFVRSPKLASYNVQDIQGNLYSISQGSKLSQQVEFLNYRGYSAGAGFSYMKRMNNAPFDLFIGGMYDIHRSMNSTSLQYEIKPGTVDTVESTGSHSIPAGLGIGTSLIFKDSLDIQRFMISLDYVSKKYNNLQNNRVGIGFEKLSNPNSIKGFGKNLLRAGGYFSQNELLYNNGGVDEFGITFGIGIPRKRTSAGSVGVRSIFDLGIQAGKHGTVADGGIEESFVRINLGLTFNDRWFQRIRIN